MELIFHHWASIINTIMIAMVLLFLWKVFKKKEHVSGWGRLIFAFVIMGTGISILSAIRDGYATQNAVFAMNSIQSTICSLAGGMIYLLAFLSILVKQQRFRRNVFFSMSLLFFVQIAVIELSKLARLLLA